MICKQNTRKYRSLHKNSIQGEESNLQQNLFNHKQGIQNTPLQAQHTRAPSSLALPKRVDTASNSARTAPNTDKKRMRGKAIPQCKRQNDGIRLALVAEDRFSKGSNRKRELASEESPSIYRCPRRLITGFNELMII